MVIYQTRFMAQLLGVKNIRVNTVAPGVTMSPATKTVVPQEIIDTITASTALNSTLEPEDMTGVVVFLASDDSSKMTGQILDQRRRFLVQRLTSSARRHLKSAAGSTSFHSPTSDP